MKTKGTWMNPRRDSGSSFSRKRLLVGFEAAFEHGLLVIASLDSEAAHETFDPLEEAAHLDHDSLYVPVRAAVDGLVKVLVFEEKAPRGLTAGLSLVFDGRFEADYGVVELEDASDSIRARVSLEEDGPPHVRVYRDDAAAEIVVVLGEWSRQAATMRERA
ncbi:hypothetical protein [Oerskovia jenensis]|uniref:hypothetical protein n=1 Tax=Oerskovia jenensis TaxID=162169 RepID=UPI0036DAA235